MVKIPFLRGLFNHNKPFIPPPVEESRLSTIDDANSTAHVSPVDYTKELLKSEAKDKRLFKYYQFYKKRDFHDRYLKPALFMSLMAFVLSFVSSYLSYPFLTSLLTEEIPIHYLSYAVVVILILIETVKHLSLGIAYQTHYTYKQTPFISGTLVLLAVSASIYMCVNGVKTKSNNTYTPPPIESITTQYDTQINQLKKDNKRIFDTNNWKGKINESSKAGKAYASNEITISNLQLKAAKERESKYNKALSKYDTQHTNKTDFRLWFGYVVESGILFCGGFFFYFMFNSSFEHIARIKEKYLNAKSNTNTSLSFANSSPIIKPVKASNTSINTKANKTTNNASKTSYNAKQHSNNEALDNNIVAEITDLEYQLTDKLVTYQKACNNLASYHNKLRTNKGRKERNQARINYWSYLINIMEKNGANRVREIKFVENDWTEEKELCYD